jgi:ligand-binding sensor domain-containing protein
VIVSCNSQLVTLFADIFAKNCDPALAKMVTFSVETAMYNQFINDDKGYVAKYRLLSANLKRNQVRVRILTHILFFAYWYVCRVFGTI